jgi:hypothetical protein
MKNNEDIFWRGFRTGLTLGGAVAIITMGIYGLLTL